MAVAALALAACSKNETVEVAGNQAIGFNAFVNNTTRAVTELDADGLESFYVFGNYGDAWSPIFTNVKVTGGQVDGSSIWTPELNGYWTANAEHRFAAYSDGNAKFDGASFAPATQVLTFANYTQEEIDGKDLIVAIPAAVTNVTDPTTQAPVDLSFIHMLSQVIFTFTNSDSYDYEMEISNVTIVNEGASQPINQATGTCSYNGGNPIINWETNTQNGAYEFGTLEDIAVEFTEETHTLRNFVIPQSNTNNLKVSFTATFTDGVKEPITGNFTASLAYNGDVEGTTANTWTPGFRYNYTVEINASTINPEMEEQIIEFTVSAIDDWTDATNSDMTLD